MSMPSSAIASIASGRTTEASTPALWASNRSPPHARSSPSAIWERALLWTQRKRTRVIAGIVQPTRTGRSAGQHPGRDQPAEHPLTRGRRARREIDADQGALPDLDRGAGQL